MEEGENDLLLEGNSTCVQEEEESGGEDVIIHL